MVRTLVTRPTIEAFCCRLLDTLQKSFGETVNADESGFEFDTINKIIAAARGVKRMPKISKGQHEKVTALACASTAGSSLLPMFIYKSQSRGVPNDIH